LSLFKEYSYLRMVSAVVMQPEQAKQSLSVIVAVQLEVVLIKFGLVN